MYLSYYSRDIYQRRECLWYVSQVLFTEWASERFETSSFYRISAVYQIAERSYHEGTKETKSIGKHLEEIGERDACRIVETEDTWLRSTASERRTRELWHSDCSHLTSPKNTSRLSPEIPQFVPTAPDISRNRRTLEIVENFERRRNRARPISGMQSSVIAELRSFPSPEERGASHALRSRIASWAIPIARDRWKMQNTTKGAASPPYGRKRRRQSASLSEKRESEDRRTRTKLWMKERRRKCGATSRLDESTKF